MLSKAISITAQAFEGKYDKGGNPYILHCLHVMNQMPEDDEELRCIAVMHDLVEDTDWTENDFLIEGFPLRVVSAIGVLTHKHEEPYDYYIQRIAERKDARLVKLADLKHNMDITRLKSIGRSVLNRIEKYHRAYTYLSGGLLR